jgi:hypothetical protein
MANPIDAFIKKHHLLDDEIWEVRPRTYAIKHSTCERLAHANGITFEPPLMLEFHSADKIAALVVTGKMGDRTEWATGEAAPYNNKNGYPFAMAEKRGKDRVILKLLNGSEAGLYSEEEAEDFRKRENPHVTRPSDIFDEIEYDDHGNPIDNIPHGDGRIERLPKAKARADFAAAQFELRQIKTEDKLKIWGNLNANRIASYPVDWQEMLRGIYADHMKDLRTETGNGAGNGRIQSEV